MDLRQLRYLDAVVRHGGFTRAAEQLHVAQSAISARIRDLEDELGVVLLRRTTRRVSLTADGDRLLAGARVVLAQMALLRTEMATRGASLRGRVRIGATDMIGALPLAALLARFRDRHPAVGMSLHSGLVAELHARLARRDLDFIVAPVHNRLPRRFAAEILVEEGLVLITPPSHSLASRRAGPVTLMALRDESFVSLPPGSGLRTLLIRGATNAGVKARVEFETSGPMAMRELVASGLGVALCARSTAEAAGPPVHVRDVKGLPPHPPIGLIRLRAAELEAPAQALWRHLAEASAKAR